MKIIRNTLLTIVSIAVISVATLYATGNGFIINAVKRTYLSGYKTANINDHSAFDVTTIKTSSKTPIPSHPNYNKTPLSQDF